MSYSLAMAEVLVLAALLGLATGSFLNVVIFRVPRGLSVVTPRSACPGCRQAIQPRDNIPVLSWLALRGKCRGCAEPISKRYPLVELATAAVFVALTARLGAGAALPAFLYLGAVGLSLSLIDLDTRRLPNSIVLPSYAVGLALLGLAAGLRGDPGALIRAVEGMCACYGVYFAIAFVYPAGMGFGDVKLAGLLGLFLGFLGWSYVLVGMFLGVLFGGLFGVALLALRRGGRKTAIPFGPFMIAGAFVALLAASQVAHAYLHSMGVR